MKLKGLWTIKIMILLIKQGTNNLGFKLLENKDQKEKHQY